MPAATTATRVTTVFDRMPTPPCAALLGWRLIDQDAGRGWIRVQFDGKPRFANPTGAIQGGMLAAMLDDTLGPALFNATGGAYFPTTIDLHVTYLAPAKPGALYGEGRVVQRGKTIAFLEGELSDAEGRVVARATATARLVPAPKGA